ncbi:MAG: sugar phosphate isomerase/epimerase [Planctomycetales bacterium]|nr:sugar phosphate isomerase/epimerase [Planctomycetales bacterium]
MAQNPQVILTGFADESANHKTALEQFSAYAAAGMKYYSIRFIDVGNGIKNVMKLDKAEVKQIVELQKEFGLQVSSLGSPIGKVKLLDVDDGTKNAFIPFKKYLKEDVKKACDLANAFGTKLIRGFSFYHPKGTDPHEHIAQVVDQLGPIAELCDANGLTFGLEIEANLVGQTGQILAELHKKVKSPALVTIFDAGNIITQGFTPAETFEQYLAMKPGLGWVHIKDYRHPQPLQRQTHVDEEALKNFVPANLGDSGHEIILRDLRSHIPKMEKTLKKRGVPGVFLDLEPHVKGGGQFGGFSGPDGFGVALRGLCKVLDYVDIDYHLRDFDDVLQLRGF